jgi:hypothetical protein
MHFDGGPLAAVFEKVLKSRVVERKKGGAFRCCSAVVGCALLLGCGMWLPVGRDAPALQMLTAPAPSDAEQYCAWYGDSRDQVLYFGASPFWPAFREAGGDPTADLREEGPQIVGRFDLKRLAFAESLVVGGPGARAGVWDVLAHPNGRIYFTTYFESAGYVDHSSGRVQRFESAGLGLNELYLGEDGVIVATRYGEHAVGEGSVVVLDAEGRILAEHPLEAPKGYQAAPKSVAFDPIRKEIWVNTDLLPTGKGQGEVRYDTRVLGPEGRERLRFERPEVQFMAFGPDGTGYFAERDGPLLNLRIRPPERAGAAIFTGRIVPLDDAFAGDQDFVQDIHVDGEGRVVVTRWSGRIHLVNRRGEVELLRLPRPGGDGLYYTGVLAGERLCATYCGGVTVVCQDLER